jgi:phosphomannomutase
MYVAYDTREHAGEFARLAAETIAAEGFEVILSDSYAPTPALCWTVSRDPQAIGGIQLTASHNPAGWLGFKVRMSDGGASPLSFTNRIEELLGVVPPADQKSTAGTVRVQDLMSSYLEALSNFVDKDAIRSAQIKVLVDPLFGAARVYLADCLEELGLEVARIHDEQDFNFGGLHPEPIEPWVDAASTALRGVSADAAFVLDGDADRLGALDEEGNFVAPPTIIALLALHLVEGRGQKGRIVKTLSTSQVVDRVAESLGAELTTTPIGFKWIYEEMLKGDVLIGGEESGGIGVPQHLCERDGLLMTLLLVEMMAQRGQSLKELVADLEARLGKLYYQRRDLSLAPEMSDQMDRVKAQLGRLRPAGIAGAKVVDYLSRDGIKFHLEDSEWLLLRASGTEPLVRIYAEAASPCRLALLLGSGEELLQRLVCETAA